MKNKAPERIWVELYYNYHADFQFEGGIEYIRADVVKEIIEEMELSIPFLANLLKEKVK